MHSHEKTCKLPIWRVFRVKIPPKCDKSNACHQNVIGSKGGQDTPVCPILGHSSYAFWGKSPVTPNITCFPKSKWPQNEENLRTMTTIWLHDYSSDGGQHTSSCKNASHSSPVFSRKCQQITNVTCFTKFRCKHDEEKKQTVTKI